MNFFLLSDRSWSILYARVIFHGQPSQFQGWLLYIGHLRLLHRVHLHWKLKHKRLMQAKEIATMQSNLCSSLLPDIQNLIQPIINNKHKLQHLDNVMSSSQQLTKQDSTSVQILDPYHAALTIIHSIQECLYMTTMLSITHQQDSNGWIQVCQFKLLWWTNLFWTTQLPSNYTICFYAH